MLVVGDDVQDADVHDQNQAVDVDDQNQVVDVDVESVSVDELGARLCSVAAHIAAATYRWLVMLAAFDRRRGWAERDGCISCVQWLGWRCGLEERAAREKIRVAHALQQLPKISAAFAAGQLSYSKVRAVTRIATPAIEDDLLMMAIHGTAGHLERIVRYFRGVERAATLQEEQGRREARYLRYRWDWDGSLIGEFRLPPEDGAVFINALEVAAYELGMSTPSRPGSPPAGTPPAGTPPAGPPPAGPAPAGGLPPAGVDQSGERPALGSGDRVGHGSTPLSAADRAEGRPDRGSGSAEPDDDTDDACVRSNPDPGSAEPDPEPEPEMAAPAYLAELEALVSALEEPPEPTEWVRSVEPVPTTSPKDPNPLGWEGDPTGEAFWEPWRRSVPSPRSGNVRRSDDEQETTDRPPNLGHRYADAFSLLAHRFITSATGNKSTGDRYLTFIHVDLSTVTSGTGRAYLDDGPAISAETASQVLCDGSYVPVFVQGGEVLDIGRKTRSVPPSIRRALRIRDQGCRYPGCGRKGHAEAHHVYWWSLGGPTKLEWLVELCPGHHRLIHHDGFTCELVDDGGFQFRRPDGTIITDTPRIRVEPDAVEQANAEAGAQITSTTINSQWGGERCDYDLAICGLFYKRDHKPASDDTTGLASREHD